MTTTAKTTAADTILAIDLGKYKSVACAPTIERQIEIRKEYLEFTKEIEELCEIYAIPCPGSLPRMSMEEYKLAQVARLDAEIDLLRARRKLEPR